MFSFLEVVAPVERALLALLQPLLAEVVADLLLKQR
jgi:hypothetical protein